MYILHIGNCLLVEWSKLGIMFDIVIVKFYGNSKLCEIDKNYVRKIMCCVFFHSMFTMTQNIWILIFFIITMC